MSQVGKTAADPINSKSAPRKKIKSKNEKVNSDSSDSDDSDSEDEADDEDKEDGSEDDMNSLLRNITSVEEVQVYYRDDGRVAVKVLCAGVSVNA